MSIKIDKVAVLERVKKISGAHTDAAFADFLGIAPTTLSSWRSRNTFDLDIIYSKCVGISLDWLIEGEGEIFKAKSTEKATVSKGGELGGKLGGERKVQKTPPYEPGQMVAGDVIKQYPADQLIADQMVPFYDLPKNEAIVDIFNRGALPKNFMYLPDLPRCDGAIMWKDDRMTPEIKHGDIIAFKKVNDLEKGVFFGQMYLVAFELDGDMYISLQYIHESEDKDAFRLVSENSSKYPAQDIPRSSVKEMAAVRASIRYIQPI